MPRIKIDKNKCKGCMLCVAFCPRALIVRAKDLNKKGIHHVDYKTKENKSACTGCAMCAIMCPEACIEVWK